MLFGILALLVLGLVAAIIVLDPRRRGKNLPPIEGTNLPILGAMPSFAFQPVKTVQDAYKKHGDIFTLHLAGFNMTYLIGPEAHQVFFKGSDEELSPKEAYQFVVPVFGKGVVYDSPTHIMYEQLAFVKSGLMASQLKKNVPIIEREARMFFEKWGDKGEIDMLDHMNRLTILTASRCLLGCEIREDPTVATQFAALYHDLEGGLNPIAFFFPNIPIPAHRKRDKARVEISKLFSKIIKARRQLPQSEKPDDMLQMLMECEYKDGSVLDDDKIAGLLIGLLFAGQHTSGITSTWTGFYLCQYPEYFKMLVEEQKEIIKEFGTEISFESLRKSTKLEGCVRESLRMHPPLIMLMRKVMIPMQYKEYTIPAGDLLCVSPSVAMRLPEVYPNPDQYDPTRMERKEYSAVPYSYLAFGGGRHGCPGENFGIMQIKTLWTVLLRTFEFEMPGKLPVPDYTNLVVGPEQPALMRYKKRADPLE